MFETNLTHHSIKSLLPVLFAILLSSLGLALLPARPAHAQDPIDIGDLPPGKVVTITFRAAISNPLPAGVTEVCNQGQIGGDNFATVDTDDPATGAANDPTCTLIDSEADLGVTKSNDLDMVIPGTVITYTIVVTNAGPQPVTGALVSDTFPSELTGVDWTCVEAGGANCNGSSGAGDLNQTVDLPAGGIITYTAAGLINSDSTGLLANTAFITTPAGINDPVSGNNSATDADFMTSQADLEISKDDGQTTAVPGQLITYTIAVTNHGPSEARSVVVSDTYPADLAHVADTCGAAAGPPWVWDVGILAAGGADSCLVTFTIASSATGSLANPALVDPGITATDPDNSNNLVTDTNTIDVEADLVVTMTESVDPVTAGSGPENLTYVVTVENLGPSDVSGVTLTDTLTLTTGVTVGSITPSGSTTWDDVSETWTVGSLPSGVTETLTISLTVGPSAAPGTDVVMNEAALTAVNETESNPANNSAGQATSIETAADLVVLKTDSSDPVAAGGTLTYTITITNNGPSDAQGIVATDTLPGDVTFNTSSGCDEDPNGAPTCSLGTVAAGSATSYTLVVDVNFGAAGPLTNTVSVTSTTTEANPGDESDSETTAVDIVADLEISKLADPDPAAANQPLTYTLTVTNNGPSAATGVSVQDDFPSEFTYLGDDCSASVPPPGTVLTWSIGTMAADDIQTCVITGVVNAGVSGIITNTAAVTYSSSITDPNTGNDTVETPTTVFDNAFSIGDVTLAEGDSGNTAFTFVISRTSTGPASSVVVETADDTALAGSDYEALGPIPVNFAAGGSLTQTVTVSVSGDIEIEPDETFFVNLSNPVAGSIDDGQGAGVILNDDFTNLAIAKSGPATALPGAAITYTITVNNLGPAGASTAVVSDTIPAQVNNPTWNCTPAGGATCTAAGSGNISQTVSLPPGSSLTYTINGTLDSSAAGIVVNTATITAPGNIDPTPDDNVASVTTTLASTTADLAITKSSVRSDDGGTITYTVTVNNLGPGNADGATVADSEPAGVTFDSWTCVGSGGATCGSGSGDLNDTAITFPAGGQLVYTIVGTVLDTQAELINTATITAPAGVTDPETGNNSATDTSSSVAFPIYIPVIGKNF